MKNPWFGVALVLCGLSFMTGALIAGLRFNASESMPRGFWLERPFNGVPQRGDVVLVCLPADDFIKRYLGPGNCKTGIQPMLKTVVAISGDDITLSEKGITINDQLLLNTAPLKYDEAGRELFAWPFGSYKIEPGTIFLISTWSERSFDSRYIGPVNVDTIIARSIPFYVWK